MPGARLVVAPKVAQGIRHLAPDIKRSVKAALRAISANPAAGEPLQRELRGLWKFRVRRYRIIYRKVGRDIRIVAVGERRSIYEEVAELLRSQS